MKKIMILAMALLLCVPVVMADNDKALRKELNKEFKKKVKQYRKEKWNVMGSRTLEVSLLKHYEKLNDLDDDAREVFGIARTKTKNNGYQAAANNAMLKYASDAGSYLKGRVLSDVFADGATPDSEFDHFFGAYERLVEKEIKGELEESFSMIKTMPDNTYEVQVFYVISENAAAKARMRALRNALEESKAAQQYADQLSKFVQEGFSQN